jgi:lysophospholipase L1-like esterase
VQAGREVRALADHTFERDRIYAAFPIRAGDIVFVGDSFIDYFEPAEVFQRLHILNRGMHGEFSHGVNRFMSSLLAGKPSQVFVLVGVNDLLNHIPTEETLDNFRSIARAVRKESPGTQLLIISLLPMQHRSIYCVGCNERIVQLNAGLETLCRAEQTTFINAHDHFLAGSELRSDLALSDGLHLNGKGYLLLRDLLLPYLAPPRQ